MAGKLALVWLVAGSAVALAGAPEPGRFEFTETHMAVPIKFVFYATDAKIASAAAQTAFARVAALDAALSDYDPDSELRRLCATAGEGTSVQVSEDLWRVLCRAIEVSEQSQGAFDVSIGPVSRLWRRARRRYELPAAEDLEPARARVDYRWIQLDSPRQAVRLAKPGMLLDLGGIAKGYVAGEALSVFRKFGIKSVLVEAGGDLALGDAPPGRPGWRIGLAPMERNAAPREHLWLARTAVATSGDLWQYVEIGGRRYSHLIDPRTGLGLTDHSMVTLVAPDGMTADALASAVCVLGPEKGLKLVEATPGAAALIRRAPDGRLQTYESSRWKRLPALPCGPPEGPRDK